jgi:hypothetical protein
MDLEAGAEYVDVGTSGFTTGEDVILATASLDVAKRYDAQRREEMRAAWISYHAGQARRHRRTLEALIEDHKAQAARLCED